MALAKCRECGNTVSTEAQACPHCGVPRPVTASAPPVIPRQPPPVPSAPTKKKSRGILSSCLLIIFLLVGGFILLGVMLAVMDGQTKKAQPEPTVDQKAEAARATRREQRRQLESSNAVVKQPAEVKPTNSLAAQPAATPLPDSKYSALTETLHKYINTLYDKSITLCFVGKGNAPGHASTFAISGATIFSNERERKLWLLVTVAAFGKLMNDNPEIPFDRVSLSDRQLIGQRKAFDIDPLVAKEIQAKMQANKLEIDEAYAMIERALRGPFDVPKDHPMNSTK